MLNKQKDIEQQEVNYKQFDLNAANNVAKKLRELRKEKFESREINNILVEEKQTEKLLKILVDNKVTPIALDDVLTDLIKVP